MRNVGRGKPPQRLLDLGRGSYFGALELPPEQRALLVPSVYSRPDTTTTEGCTLMRVRRVEFDYRGGKSVLLSLAIAEAEAWIHRLKSHGAYRATNLDGFDRYASAADDGRPAERATLSRVRSGLGGGAVGFVDAEALPMSAARGVTTDGSKSGTRSRRLRAISHDFSESGGQLPAVGSSAFGPQSLETRPQSAALGRAPVAQGARPKATEDRAMHGLAYGSFRLALASSPASITSTIASASAASLASLAAVEEGKAGGAGSAPFGSPRRRAVHRGGAVYWVRTVASSWQGGSRG